ncbi:hypothetical protein NDU88_003367 [Pleurodeles waltl]|uniref:Uncharacterized protein n=1 Tax=Pleurodeles waltl TaxID=8319 RepID=A0AAV7W5Z6_PLEWA|nr:hypothetical protein NDU88_003367 [Pleurodeles waltl]
MAGARPLLPAPGLKALRPQRERACRPRTAVLRESCNYGGYHKGHEKLRATNAETGCHKSSSREPREPGAGSHGSPGSQLTDRDQEVTCRLPSRLHLVEDRVFHPRNIRSLPPVDPLVPAAMTPGRTYKNKDN